MKYAWIQEQHAEFSVTRLCRILEVSRSGYYEWLGRPPSVQPDADQQLEAKVQQYFAQGRGTLRHAPDQASVERRRACG